ncbi:MAG: electron transport complex subunit RsxC [Tissierellia bacterium]|nr:electron transport complex subunit RsxC [Tissierellia bacterium]
MESKRYTFKGGVHVPHNKHFTENKQVELAKDPEVVYISMQQHIGAPCAPLVNKGDYVKLGQKIGESNAFVSSPIHSSVSGTVKDVGKMVGTSGLKNDFIIIESDGKNEKSEEYFNERNWEDLNYEEVLAIIKDSGITGMGGASFPTVVKLSPPPDKKVDTVILNGAECEPYLTSDYRLMVESPRNVYIGCRIIMKALKVDKGYIAIEDNKMEAYEKIKEAVGSDESVKVVLLKTKYPQGDEKRIIDALLNRQVPSGGLPADVGCVVDNVATANAIYEAVVEGKPLYERIMTVTGDGIKEPKNLKIKVGTKFSEIIEQCGGFSGNPGKIIAGGPMMGIAQGSTDIAAVKASGGLLILNEEEAFYPEPSNCLKCGKCLDVCPVHLQPIFISGYALNKNFEMAEKYNALDCVECGSCSFICPANRPLVESIRFSKRQILAKNKKK